jgi:hypothetical protein
MSMLRTCLFSVLVSCAVAPALAQNGRNAAAGACPELEAQSGDEAARAGASHARATAARSKYAAPAASPGPTRGGGGSDDDAALRLRAPKWHSFLPGMFR